MKSSIKEGLIPRNVVYLSYCYFSRTNKVFATFDMLFVIIILKSKSKFADIIKINEAMKHEDCLPAKLHK